jgi:hypothetical protein
MIYKNGHEFEMKQISPKILRVDPEYQRMLDERRVERIVKEFNGDTFNEPKVSYREGVYWIFDGQHSVAVWRKIYGDKPIMCKVFRGMTWLDECEAFVQQNGYAKDPTTNQKLKARYNAKDEEIVDMVRLAELCGFIVDFQSNKIPTRIVCTSALVKAYKKLGADAYLDMLTAIKEAWYGDIDALNQNIIKGLTCFYHTYRGNFKHDELVKALKRISPAEIMRNGKNYTGRANSYTREIVKAYNFHKKNRLNDSELDA